MPSRAALAVPAAVLAVGALVAGCGSADAPTSRPTVTVFVEPPAAAAATRTPSRTSAPTTSAEPSTSSTSPVPTALAAGHQRGAPHSWAEARARVEAASPAAAVTQRFTSPSGNIVCAIGEGSGARAACEVASGRVAPPVASLCPAAGRKTVGRIELGQRGAVPVCSSDTIRAGGEPKLRYGSRTASLDPVACVSEEVGVTCVDSTTRHGFFLARSTFVTF